jgi:hypothetical protein
LTYKSIIIPANKRDHQGSKTTGGVVVDIPEELISRFTEGARRVLTLALEEVGRFNHSYMGTEHLLLGLTSEESGGAHSVLAKLGVEVAKVRSAVDFIVGRGAEHPSDETGLTPRARKVLELAVDEAERLEDEEVDTEHILLGLVREGEAVAASVLESLGADLYKVRPEVLNYRGGLAGQAKGPVEEPAGPVDVSTLTIEEIHARIDRACRDSEAALVQFGLGHVSQDLLHQVYDRWEELLLRFATERRGQSERLRLVCAEILAVEIRCYPDLRIHPGEPNRARDWLHHVFAEIWEPLALSWTQIPKVGLAVYRDALASGGWLLTTAPQ